MPQGALWPNDIVIDPPALDLIACVFDGHKLRDVQTLIAQPTIERFYGPFSVGFSGVSEVELHATLVRPLLERL